MMLLPTLLLTVVLLGLWEGIVRLLSVQSFVLPAPSSIAAVLVDHQGLLLHAAGTTAVEISVGFLLSALVGAAVALVIERFARFGRALYPLVVLFQTVPKVALAPIFVLWFGYDLMPKVALIVVIAFFPVALSMLAGLESVDRSLVSLMRSVGARRSEILWRVQVPHALPQLMAGLKIAITFSVIGAIVGEFSGASAGLGYVIQFASSQLDAPTVFAALVEVSLLGIVFYYLIEILERLAVPWAAKFDRTARIAGHDP
ncbi:MAG TPA: ABC transporter permease [Acetobacteraceae bacterium]|nr:ABC transporter permease [Acetobacteraceae bacterium]